MPKLILRVVAGAKFGPGLKVRISREPKRPTFLGSWYGKTGRILEERLPGPPQMQKAWWVFRPVGPVAKQVICEVDLWPVLGRKGK